MANYKFDDLKMIVDEKYEVKQITAASLKQGCFTPMCFHGTPMMKMNNAKTPTLRCSNKQACPLVIDGAALKMFYESGYIKWDKFIKDGEEVEVWKLNVPVCSLCKDQAGFTLTLSTFMGDKCTKYISYMQPLWRCSCDSAKVRRAATIINVIGNEKLEQSWNINAIASKAGLKAATGDNTFSKDDASSAFDFSNIPTV